MSTLCCSDICKKRTECARHIMNNEGTYYVEDFYTFVSGIITPSSGCTTYRWCGELGNWGLFKPIIEKSCAGCVYEDVDGSTEDISNCVCCSRNVGFAKKDNYRKR